MQITCNFPDDVLPIGTKVFLPRAAINSVQEDEIIGYYCIMVDVNKDGKPTIVPTDYRLRTINLGRGSLTDGWKSNEFFLSHAEAKANAVEYNVQATSEEWFKAIGLTGTEDEDRTQYDEECELGPCCADISAIRDILYDVCISGKIDAITRTSLIMLLNTHDGLVESPNLDKILSQLNIVWKDPGETDNPSVTEIKNENITDNPNKQ